MIQVSHIADSKAIQQDSNENVSSNELQAHQIIKINHINHTKSLKQPENDKSIFFHKFSTKFLVIFTLIAVSTIILCSILIAVMTSKFFIMSWLDELDRETSVYKNINQSLQDTVTKSTEFKSNKIERNSLNNWMQSFGKNPFDSNNKKYLQNNHFPGCGKPFVEPHLVYTRIMNGKEAVPNSWPYAVSIAFQGPRDSVPHACGGTLINKRYILTAAHCVHKSSVYALVGGPIRNSNKYNTVEKMMRIYVGIHDRFNDVRQDKVYGVEAIKVHYRFNPETFKNDLALVKLDRDVELSSHVGFVCVTKTSRVTPGDSIYAVGWGYTEKSRSQASRYLMQVDLIVQRKDTCLIQYDEQDQFCAGNVYKKKDTCNVGLEAERFQHGDSGGSLMKLINNRWTLMGVVSNGDVSCGGTGIYINVPFFYDWITANSQDY